jgi:hypothetical protein
VADLTLMKNSTNSPVLATFVFCCNGETFSVGQGLYPPPELRESLLGGDISINHLLFENLKVVQKTSYSSTRTLGLPKLTDLELMIDRSYSSTL